MLERASYYGLRALVVIYMVGETLKMDNSEAFKVYGWFTASMLFSQIVGALLGDLLVGNKKSIIIGGIIQALGAFVLCIPSTFGLYLGLFLVVLGSGLFNPNVVANFGKSYLKKTKLLDAGFTILYFAVNVGAFVGAFLTSSVGSGYGFKIGFLISGVFSMLSIIPIFLTKEIALPKFESTSITRRIINIAIAFVLVGLFWGIYEISNIRVYDLQIKFKEVSSLGISDGIWQILGSSFSLPISIVLILLWTFVYNSQFFKLLIGFVFGAIALGILLFIPEVPEESHIPYFLISLLFLAVSEIHIAPIIQSILTQYSNPKYLAILISLSFVPVRGLAAFFGIFNDRFYEDPNLAVKIGFGTMVIISFGIIAYLIVDKIITQNNSPKNSHIKS
jgi:POT family proton-dependent oligopeptide transporter